MTIKQISVFLENKSGRLNTDVIAIHCQNQPGALSKILESLAEEHIFIEYMYAFAQSERADVIINPNDLEKCLQLLKEKHPDIL